MKPLVIYHDHCTDGFGAAFCAWLKFGDEAEYLPMSYGKFDEYNKIVKNDREVYILDFSLPKPAMDDLLNNAKRVVWLDHHKTAFEMWCETEREKHVELHPLPNNHTIVLDNSKSGAMLAWEYFHPNDNPPEYIELIDDRDRWQFKYEGSKPFHAGMASEKPWSFEQWLNLVSRTDKVVQTGNVLMKSLEQQVTSIAKYARPCDLITSKNIQEGEYRNLADLLGLSVDPDFPVVEFSHHHGLAVNTNVHMSEVGHELANKSGTYGLIWYLGENNKVKVSLRSNGDYDVSAIAKEFGGGGHKNAAGLEIDLDTFIQWLK